MFEALWTFGSEAGHWLKVAFFAFGSIGLLYIIGNLLLDMYEVNGELLDEEDEDD